MQIAHVRKFVVAAAAALAVLGASLADGEVTASEGVSVAVAFLGALGVYQVPNKPTDES